MSAASDLNWKSYEMITKYIYEVLGKDFGVKIVGYGSSCKIVGKSGLEHQIDVLTAHSDGIHSYKTAIECKYWNQKINKDIVMKVSEVIQDAGINKGVIVAKRGFTRDALEFARHKGVGLVELKELTDEEFNDKAEKIELGLIDIHTRSSILRPEIISTSIECVEKAHDRSEAINIYATVIELPNGCLVPFTTYTRRFQDELHNQNKLFQPITKRYEISGRLVNKTTNASVEIKGLTFRGILKKIDSSSDLKFSIVDQVWLIMKSIFEERAFQISRNGGIVEIKK